MIGRSATCLGLFLLLSCAPEAEKVPEPEGGEGPDRIALPTADEINAACFRTPGEMADEEARQAAEGVHIEPTYEEFLVRNAECVWQARRPPTARCTFEQESIPMGSQEGEERRKHLEWLKDRHWTRRTAVLTYRRDEGWTVNQDWCPTLAAEHGP